MLSRNWIAPCMPSTVATMFARRTLYRNIGSISKVWAIGAGSASPVVSITMRSKSGNLPSDTPSIRSRSPCCRSDCQCTADAPILKDHRVLDDRADKQVIKPDLAELVD